MIEEFIKSLGYKEQVEVSQWDRIIQPKSSYLITGDVGTGKSALAFYLLERFSQKYDLLPTVVGFPREKQHLLPDNFIIKDSPSECTQLENAIVFIDEADMQLPIEDTKARKYVVNFLSERRQRHQIFLLSFHFPRLVLGRYLPFFSAFLFKRPPYLIEFAGKRRGDVLTDLMNRAEERFSELPGNGDVVKNTYVVAPGIRWQGMLQNELCSFWNEDLSEVWSGAEIKEQITMPKLSLEVIMNPRKEMLIPISEKDKEMFSYALSVNGVDATEKNMDSMNLCNTYGEEEIRRLSVDNGLSDTGHKPILCGRLIAKATGK